MRTLMLTAIVCNVMLVAHGMTINDLSNALDQEVSVKKELETELENYIDKIAEEIKERSLKGTKRTKIADQQDATQILKEADQQSSNDGSHNSINTSVKRELEREIEKYIDKIAKENKDQSTEVTKKTATQDVNRILKDVDLQSTQDGSQWHHDSDHAKDITMRSLLKKVLGSKIKKSTLTDAERKRAILKILRQHDDDKDASSNEMNNVDTCFDLFGTEKCRILVHDPEYKIDCHKDRMHEMCEKSCGYCSVPSPPMLCQKSKYGCCEYDNFTPKTDPLGTTCPGCKDNAPKLCAEFESECNDIGMGGEWMRKNCIKTCHGCKEHKKACSDEKDYEQYCSTWKKDGLCELIPELKSEHCKKSCGNCV